jgi:hypothetical protein
MADGITDDEVARMIRALNEAELSADSIARLAPLVRDVNARVAAAARARLTIDATPWSYLSWRAECAAGEGE